MAPPGSSGTSNPDGSSALQNADSRGRPGAITSDPRLINNRSREGIMPSDDHRKAGHISPFWVVKVTLLPSASWTTRPEKDSNEYLRLKSRNLICKAMIHGSDSASINSQISNLFLMALKGREWMPLQTLQDPITSEIHLSTLASSDHIRDRDFNFLADTCLIQNEKQKLYLFIAPASGQLTWNFIRRLPRVLPRSYKIEEEDIWESDNSNDQSVGDEGTNQQNNPRHVLEAASNQLPDNSPSHLIRTEPTPSDTAISTTTTPMGKKGKYLCPYSTCPRSRVPFQSQKSLTEHISRHKAAYKEDVTPEDTNPRPLASEEPEDPKPSMAVFQPLQPSVESAIRPSEPLYGPDSTVFHRQRRSLSSASPGVLPQQSQKQLEPEANLDFESIPAASENSEIIVGGTIARDIAYTMALFSNLPFRTRAGESSSSSSNENHTSRISIRTPNRTNGSRKRRRMERGDEQQNNDDDSGNDGSDPRKTGNGPSNLANPLRLFACPFYKYDPKKYESCEKQKWRDVHRVKEHLYRKHKLPQHECPRCHERFEEKQDLDDHAKAEQACSVSSEPDIAEGVTAEQIERLRSRKRNVDEIQKWNLVYKILFIRNDDDDDDVDMPSPWYEPQQLVNVNEFRNFLCNPRPLTYQQDTKRILAKKIDDFLASNLADRDSLVDGLMKIFQTHQIESLDQFIQTLPGKGPPLTKTSDKALHQQSISESDPHCSPVLAASPAASGLHGFRFDNFDAGNFSQQGPLDSFFCNPIIDPTDEEYDLTNLNAGNYSLSS